MAKGPNYRVSWRRKREQKTDYHKRKRSLMAGKPRAVVRKTSQHTRVQIIEMTPQGDKVLASAHTSELSKLGWKAGTGNMAAAYLAGYLCGTRSVASGTKEGVFDMGFIKPIKGSKVYAALKGLVDANMDIPHDEVVLPGDDRIRGEHVAKYAALLKKEKNKVFSKYKEHKLDPEKLPAHVDEIKAKIKG